MAYRIRTRKINSSKQVVYLPWGAAVVPCEPSKCTTFFYGENMTNLINTATPTMSSLDIAELTGKQHKDVMRDIRVMFDQLEIDSAHFCAQYKDSTGRNLPCFNLDRYHTEILVTGYDVKRRAAVIKRWYDLETKQQAPALPDFTNPVAAARAWADEVEQKQIAQEALALAAPKAAFYDAVTQSDDAISMDEVAKVLKISGMGRNKLFKLLRDKGVLQDGGLKHNQPYQRHVDAGRFRLVETSWQADNGDIRVNLKTVVLQKGLDYIRKICTE